MKHIILLFAALFIRLIANAQTPDFNWVSNGNQEKILRHSIKYDSKGNIYMLGTFTETVNVDPGGTDLTLNYVSSQPNDIFLLKYDSKGVLINGVRIGGVNFKDANEILIDKTDHLIISARFRGNMDLDGDGTDDLSNPKLSQFIAKYDSDLNFIWAAEMPYLNSMALDADCNIYTILQGEGTFTYGKKGNSKTVTYDGYFVFVTLKPDGNIKSEFSLWANDLQICIQNNRIMVDSDKNIYCSGYFTLSADFDPGPGTAVLKEIGRDYGTGLIDAFIVKFDSVGNFKWVKQIGDKYNENIISLGINNSNELLFIGSSDGNFDVDPGPGVFYTNKKTFMMKIDQNGNFIWFKPTVDNALYLFQMGLANFDSDDNVYLGGQFYDKVDFDLSSATHEVISAGYSDLFIEKLSKNGDLVWVKTFGGIYEDALLDMDVFDSTTIAFTANFTNEVWLKSGTQVKKYSAACDSCANGFLIRSTDAMNSSSINKIKSQNTIFSVYPNPSEGKFMIQSSETGQLLIYNTIGCLIKKFDLTEGVNYEMDLESEDSGLYNFVLNTENSQSTQKVLIR